MRSTAWRGVVDEHAQSCCRGWSCRMPGAKSQDMLSRMKKLAHRVRVGHLVEVSMANVLHLLLYPLTTSRLCSREHDGRSPEPRSQSPPNEPHRENSLRRSYRCSQCPKAW